MVWLRVQLWAAELFMDYLECKYIISEHNPSLRYINFWVRYVDDVCISFSGSLEELGVLHRYINGCHKNINFSLELENEGSLKYLDLEIKREGDAHTFGIFRKPSSTDILIPAESYHHPQYKTSGLIYMIDRLLNTPLSDDNYRNELDYIRHLAVVNGFQEKLVGKLIERREVKKMKAEVLGTEKIPKKSNYHCSIPYLGPISGKVGKLLGKIGVHAAYRSMGSLKNRLSKTKDAVDFLQRSGVYRISCTDCGASYVGQSGRKLRTRLKEHFTRKDSEVKKHLLKEGHNQQSLDVEVLHYANKGRRMNIVEGVNIKLDMHENPLNINVKTDGNVFKHVSAACTSSLSLIGSQSRGKARRVHLDQI